MKRPTALLPALALIACTQTMQPPATGNSITDIDWQLVTFQSSDDSIGTRTPPDTERYVLRFAADGSLTAQLDCNRLSGRWDIPSRSETGGELAITGGAMTRAMCQPGAMDSQIAQHLGFVRSFTLRDGRLYLALMADGGIYEFRRQLP